ncbi:iron chelate uptake ABC transporter family permease subunit [Agrococcus sp. HG114]|uniref:iron chelate uptake ABC transporter family permease subunit n=1 Tax=Agrococcus sp. HG114 TaxID=2969757 RepID=UPI00215A54E6|nr:iron chelate uptake ABC transporter family permease subunit [Agrococcus sp. HG114]MCR8670469.1 iron chelate uptake ABC transporter family permease subunit [Agrococcus sp. HG114]
MPDAMTAAAASPVVASARASARPLMRLALVWALALAAIVAVLLVDVRGPLELALPRRATLVGGILVASFAHAVATVIFHTVTSNRILTPSIIGFDSMYTLMQTLTVFAFGGSAIAATDGLPKLIAQTALMVVAATALYTWLLDRAGGGVLTLLLVGVVIGLAFDSVSAFLQRILSPTDYDLLSLELFGRLSSVQPDHLPLAFGVCAAVGAVVWMRRRRLDVVLLGRDGATALGVDHRRELIVALVCVSVLVAFATALAGPMTFFGFLVATLAYRLAGSHQHAFVLPMAVGLGVLALAGAQLIMRHVFDAAGLVTVIIEVVGGVVFLALLLGRRRPK